MLQIINNTPFSPMISVFPDPSGVDTAYMYLKATFTLNDGLRIAEKQVPVRKTDEYWGEPGASSLKYASDAVLGKIGTDVVLVGSAWQPKGKMNPSLDVSVAIAGKKKTIRVLGDRTIEKGLFKDKLSQPQPFVSMPLIFERAYGGTHDLTQEKGKIFRHDSNPVGQGFIPDQKTKEPVKTLIPNLEDPGSPFSEPSPKGQTACFGFIAPSWEPRKTYAGTYDEQWQKECAPYLPEDFDPRFFTAAASELCFDRFLLGGEPVELTHLSPYKEKMVFNLPQCVFEITLWIAGEDETLTPQCDTILFEPDENRLTMAWSCAKNCDQETLNLEEAEFSIKQMTGCKGV